jgi:hypothetical protein
MSETFKTIAQWCEETFGPVEPARIAERAAEEMAELLDAPERAIPACGKRLSARWPSIGRASGG